MKGLYVDFTFEACARQLRAGGELLIENSAGRFDPRSPAFWAEKAHLPPLWATTPIQALCRCTRVQSSHVS